MIIYATRYSEAGMLPIIETELVAEALVELFSWVGVPDKMLSGCVIPVHFWGHEGGE